MMEMLIEAPPADSLRVQTFADLLKIIKNHPEWREQLVRALFPDIDIAKAFQDLAKAQEKLMELLVQLAAGQEELKRRVGHLETDSTTLKANVAVLKTDVAILKTDVAVLKTDVAVLKTDVAVLKTDVSILKTDVATLKGLTFEAEYRYKAMGIFGRFIRRGKDMTNDIADLLHEAQIQGLVSDKEYEQVLAADLLWGGQSRFGQGEMVLVVEASWRGMVSDVERAQTRAAILRRIGIAAVPMVAGTEWDEDALEMATKEGVVVAIKRLIVADSWPRANPAGA